MQAINISGLNKFYGRKQVLFDIDLDFPQAQMVALIGPSGSGKSTLLRHINGLNVAESGQIQINGQDLFKNGRLNRQVRQQRSKIGYIFQQFNLVNRLSVLDNVLIGALGRIPKWRAYLRLFTQAEKQEAFDCLARVGLAEFVHQRASKLSGGQQQRVAIARALAMEPDFVLFDEPTSALDPELEAEVLRVLKELASEKLSMIIVTHNLDFAREAADRMLFLEDGKVGFDGPTKDFFESTTDPRIARFINSITI